MPRHYQQQNPWAQGFANLGTALFGSPQDDAALAQAMSQIALRDRRRAEIDQIRSQMGREAKLHNLATGGMGDLFALDPGAEDFMGQRSTVAGQLAPLFMENPEALATFMTLGTNLGGGEFGQLAQTFTDPSAIMDVQGRADQQARAAELDQAFGPGMGALFAGGSGDIPNFMQQAGAGMAVLGMGPQDAFREAMGLVENVVNPVTGDISRVGPGHFEQLTFAGDPARIRLGQEPMGTASGRMAEARQPGAATTTPPPSIARPEPTAARETPRESSEERPERPQGFQGQAIDTGVGRVEIPTAPSGEPMTMFDMIEFSSGVGAGLQRGLSRTLGQFTDDLFFQAPIATRAEMIHLNTELRPLMTVSNRPSQWELQDIQPALLNPGLVRNPAENATVLATLRNNIEAGRQEALQTLASGGLSRTHREEMEGAVIHADALLRKIGDPRDVSGAEANIARFQELGQHMFGGRQGLQQFGDQARQALEQPQGDEDDLTRRLRNLDPSIFEDQ